MMGGGAFILLKAGHCWPETAKQAKSRVANLVKTLQIADFGGENPSPRRERTCDGCISRFPRDMANLA
jgi:hypothetical protein